MHCYYNIVISTEHYRLRNYTYTLCILSTYKVVHRESYSLDFQYNSSCKKEHKCYFPSAQLTYKVEAVPHCCTVYWMLILLTVDDCCLIYSEPGWANLEWSIFSLNKAFCHAWRLFHDSVQQVNENRQSFFRLVVLETTLWTQWYQIICTKGQRNRQTRSSALLAIGNSSMQDNVLFSCFLYETDAEYVWGSERKYSQEWAAVI